MTGIYGVFSPSGNVYIGQSVNLEKRLSRYKRMTCKIQVVVYRSLLKYGAENHTYKILHHLPDDVEQSVLNEYEIFYIQQYRDCGIQLLNIKDGGGGGGKCAEETKLKIGMSNKGRKATAEQIERMSASKRGKPSPKKGKKGFKYNLTMEQRQKRSEISKRRKNFKHSEETKQLMSKNRKGKPFWNKGGKLSEEHKNKLSEIHKGKAVSKETREKISKSSIGKYSGWSKLTFEQAIEIKKQLKEGILSQYRIAKNFGVHKVTIFDIKHNKTWCHIPNP